MKITIVLVPFEGMLPKTVSTSTIPEAMRGTVSCVAEVVDSENACHKEMNQEGVTWVTIPLFTKNGGPLFAAAMAVDYISQEEPVVLADSLESAERALATFPIGNKKEDKVYLSPATEGEVTSLRAEMLGREWIQFRENGEEGPLLRRALCFSNGRFFYDVLRAAILKRKPAGAAYAVSDVLNECLLRDANSVVISGERKNE